MKTTLTILSIAAATIAHANTVQVYWNEDNASAFSFTAVGTGLDWDETFSSPSGLWSMETHVWGNYLDAGGYYIQHPIDVGNYMRGRFLGNPDNFQMQSTGYNDFFAPEAPIFDGSYLNSSSPKDGWRGITSFVLTSLPDIYDHDTWTWVFNVSARGPALHVPEAGGTLLYLALAFIVLITAAQMRRIA